MQQQHRIQNNYTTRYLHPIRLLSKCSIRFHGTNIVKYNESTEEYIGATMNVLNKIA